MDSKLREWLLTDEGVYRLYDSELSIHTQLPTSASVISILPSVAGLIYVTDSDGFLFMTLSVR